MMQRPFGGRVPVSVLLVLFLLLTKSCTSISDRVVAFVSPSTLPTRQSLFAPSTTTTTASFRSQQRPKALLVRQRHSPLDHRLDSNHLNLIFPGSESLICFDGINNNCIAESVASWYTSAAPTMLLSSSSWTDFLTMDRETAEALAGPFFGASLFPYLLFIWLLNLPVNGTPKGVTVGFATCLLFVFLTIPAAILAQVWYGVSLADCDWLHGSAESLLTVTNLVTVIAFRQAITAKEAQKAHEKIAGGPLDDNEMPLSATSYWPMTALVGILTLGAILTAVVPAFAADTQIHTAYLYGVLDIPQTLLSSVMPTLTEPENALSIPCWIIHVSSLVEFLIAMGYCWKWSDLVDNPRWKGLTWGLLPLHSSGITACTYHLFYNRIPFLVLLQAVLTCVGNTTAAFAAYRIAVSNGWTLPQWIPFLSSSSSSSVSSLQGEDTGTVPSPSNVGKSNSRKDGEGDDIPPRSEQETSLIGFEDLGDALSTDTDYTFLIKLFVGCAVASYCIKYGESISPAVQSVFLDANVAVGLSFIVIPSMLNAYKWYRRGNIDPSFEGWF